MSALTNLTVRCVFCKHVEHLAMAHDTPMCPKCFSPMVAVKASVGVEPKETK